MLPILTVLRPKKLKVLLNCQPDHWHHGFNRLLLVVKKLQEKKLFFFFLLDYRFCKNRKIAKRHKFEKYCYSFSCFSTFFGLNPAIEVSFSFSLLAEDSDNQNLSSFPLLGIPIFWKLLKVLIIK